MVSNILNFLITILGVVFLFSSITVSRRLLLPNPKKFKIINEQEYIRSRRKLFSIIGILYITLGILLILKILSINSSLIFLSLLPGMFATKINKKYLHRLD